MTFGSAVRLMLKRDVQSLRFCSKEEQLIVIVQSVFDSTWLQQHSLFYFNLIRPTTKSKVKDSLVYCWGVDNSISFKSKWRLCSLALIYTYSSLTHKKILAMSEETNDFHSRAELFVHLYCRLTWSILLVQYFREKHYEIEFLPKSSEN